MSAYPLHDEPLTAKYVLSKVGHRIYICELSGGRVGDTGICPVHQSDECVKMYIQYDETLRILGTEEYVRGF